MDIGVGSRRNALASFARQNGVFSAVLIFTTVVATGTVLAGPKPATARQLEINVVSGRPEMVSGGDALLRVDVPSSASLDHVKITLNGQNATQQFRSNAADHSLLGLVTNLIVGKNTVIATVAGSSDRTSLTLTDFPVTGPIFSGPHQMPYVCETEAWATYGLGEALDSDCSGRTAVRYFYKSTEAVDALVQPDSVPGGAPQMPRGFKPYDPSAARPTDMAAVYTTTGKQLDYLVRVETGTINRAVYQIAFLHRPDEPLPSPWDSTPGWNGRLIYTFGGGCAAAYHQGRNNGGVLNNPAISDGYAVASSTLNILGGNCNDVLSAETLMMVKEHFIKNFGPPVHTIGQGASGGAMQQHLIAQNYPGLLDGIMPERSFPETIGEMQILADCALLGRYFGSRSQDWTDEARTAVTGYVTWRTCTEMGARYTPAAVDPKSCDKVVRGQAYDPRSNPKGARCTYHDNEINVYGRDPETGFARRPLDNVGVQYGLLALNAGQISTEQFLDLNTQIGGYDADGYPVLARHSADPETLRIAYETGRFNSGGGGLSAIPIIDLRMYTEVGDSHDRIRSFMTRERLIAAQGNAANQIILTFPSAKGKNLLTPTPLFLVKTREALIQMDHWLDNITNDSSNVQVTSRVARSKPPDLVDACWTEQGEKIEEPAVYNQPTKCNQLYPTHWDPRIVAGASMKNEFIKCQLKPLSQHDYVHTFSPEQWATLQSIFPEGVCDYSRPGAGQVPLRNTWLFYPAIQREAVTSSPR